MKIIGAGFGRTGTKSMKLALEQLGFGPCYHMFEVFQHPEGIPLWHKAAFGHDIDWADLLWNYQSGVDWPLSHFWKPLADRYPDAKVLLTIRPADQWYTSMTNTIFNQLAGNEPEDDMRTQWKEMVDKIVLEDTFDNLPNDRAHCEAVFDRHTAEVKETIPSDRLIIYEVGSGWQPLCVGLGVPVPEGPFPKTNTTAEFRRDRKAEAENPGS